MKDKNELLKDNIELCKVYPFLRLRNAWTGELIEGTDFTYLDDIPYGWKYGFGLDLCKDLKAALEKDGIKDEFRFTQVKEKYGSLRLYTNNSGSHTDKVINRYMRKSIKTCCVCGSRARYITTDYILPYCKQCLPEKFPYRRRRRGLWSI